MSVSVGKEIDDKQWNEYLVIHIQITIHFVLKIPVKKLKANLETMSETLQRAFEAETAVCIISLSNHPLKVFEIT